MRLDLLIQALRDQIGRERAALRRLSRALMPVLLAPIGFALAQMVSSWVGLGVGLLIACTVLMQIELFLRPFLQRCRSAERDARCYLTLAPREPLPVGLALPYALPSLLVIVASLGLFLPTMLAGAAVWQRVVALGLGLGALWAIWVRVVEVVLRLASADARLARAQEQVGAAGEPATNLWRDGLLDPHLAQRVAGLPLPALGLSPAAQALLRVEAYLLLSERPDCTERELREALNDLGHQAHQDELAHAELPPVGGKIYMPIDAGGVLAHLLAGSVRRLGMDGAYSATLRTWLVRLPPARSYRVAGRLVDALVALRLPPSDSVLPFHLTVQGDLGQEARALSIIYLAASPLLFSERPGGSGRDERSFIMRGGGVLDDLDGRGRFKGPRTDFVDGFLIVGRTSFDAVEHLIGHTVNLRVKQVLAFGLLAAVRQPERRSPAEQVAAAHYAAFQRELEELLARYELADALEIDWLDGSWSVIWSWIERMSAVKGREPAFLEQAQELRDRTLDALERVRLARA